MPTATMPGRDLALIVAPAGLAFRAQQRLLRRVTGSQFSEVADRRITSSGAGRLVDSDAHVSLLVDG